MTSYSDSTTSSEMESSIQQVVETTLVSSQKLTVDQATRVLEDRLPKISRDITEDAVHESLKIMKQQDLSTFKNKGKKDQC